MKTFEISTTEKHTYSCTYLVTAENEEQAKELIRTGKVDYYHKELIEPEDPADEIVSIDSVEEAD